MVYEVNILFQPRNEDDIDEILTLIEDLVNPILGLTPDVDDSPLPDHVQVTWDLEERPDKDTLSAVLKPALGRRLVRWFSVEVNDLDVSDDEEDELGPLDDVIAALAHERPKGRSTN